MIICSKCDLEKDDNCFYPNKLQCKSCIRKIREAYYTINKEDILEYKKEFYQENKSDIIEYKIDYYHNNKSIVRQSQNKYKKERRKIDPSFRLRESISRAIHEALDGNKNNVSVANYLLYTIQELKEHLENQFEPWMNWNNWGVYIMEEWDDNNIATWTWQIDHVIPQSNLPYISMKDENFKKCWSLENLRPYSAKQNVMDGVTRARHQK